LNNSMPIKQPNIRSIAWGISLGLLAVACVVWSSLPTLDDAPWLRVALFSGSGIAMLGMVFFFPDVTDSRAKQLILSAAVLLRLLLWPAPVSDDVNRYLWEGMLVLDGGNPYTAPADDPRWEGRRDAVWQDMNHRDRPTAYPPGIQWIMAAAAAVSPTLNVFKALAIIGDLITLLLLLGLLRHHAAPLRSAGFYAFNPVVLIAFGAEGHFDSLMTAALLASLLSAAKGKSSTWLWLGVAIQIKLVCLILVPLFLTRRLLRGWWLFPVILIPPGLPFLAGLPEWWDGVRGFAGSGAFNAPFFTLLASTGLDLGVVRILGAAAFLATALAIFIARWRGMLLIDASLWLLGALLVCSPIVHFWYLAWLLPLTALRPSFAWTTLSITMGGYFIAWWTLAHHGWWGYGHGVATMIWLPWLIAAAAQHRCFFARLRATKLPAEDFRLCVVMPVLNAGLESEKLTETLRAELDPKAEIVIVESGSVSSPENRPSHIIQAQRGRGNQIAAGIAATEAPWIMIVHSDSLPRPGWLADLQKSIHHDPEASLLVFGQRFDRSSPGTLLLECLNEMRVVFGGVAFGDQTMVIRRSAIVAAGGFPVQPLMEDVEASLRLASQGSVIYMAKEWTLSARKWGVGFARRFGMIVKLVATYQLARFKGTSHAAAVSERMYREYYPETNLSADMRNDTHR
jgi:Glycosyl transferase family 2